MTLSETLKFQVQNTLPEWFIRMWH